MDSLREEQETLSVDKDSLKEQVKAISKAHKEQEVVIRNDGSVFVCLLMCMWKHVCNFYLLLSLHLARLLPGAEQT